MRIKWLPLLLSVLLLTMMAGCGKNEPVVTPGNEPQEEEPGGVETPSEDPSVEEPEEEPVALSLEGFGNSMSNILNDGMAVFEAPYLYHMDQMIYGSIVRTHTETEESELLLEGQFSFLNLGDGTLFFAGSYFPEGALESAYGIFRMDQDGGNLKQLYKGNITDLLLYGEYLYFFSSEKGGLCRLKYDGTEETVLVADVYEGYALINDMIYINAALDGVSESYVWRLPLSGGTPEKVDETETFGTALFPAKESVLYDPRVDGSNGFTRFDTVSGARTVFEKEATSVTEGVDDIYFFWPGLRQDNADQGIYRSKPDGSEAELLLPVADYVFSLNYVDNQLYYHTNDAQRRISVLDLETKEVTFLPRLEEIAP